MCFVFAIDFARNIAFGFPFLLGCAERGSVQVVRTGHGRFDCKGHCKNENVDISVPKDQSHIM
jgi:hypothetical protein